MSREHPTRVRLLDLFEINVETGEIRWKRSQGRAKAGSLAGNAHVNGYRRINIDGAEYLAHSIIYFVAYGEWPSLIDHANGVRDDNRITNLRQADRAANARNRTAFVETKLAGAHPYGADKFAAKLTADGIPYLLGVFDTELDAHHHYCAVRGRIEAAERLARTTVLEELQATKAAA